MFLAQAGFVFGDEHTEKETPEQAFDRLSRTSFRAADHDQNAVLKAQDIALCTESVFLAMDADDDRIITLDEFLAFDPGFTVGEIKNAYPDIKAIMAKKIQRMG